MNTTEQIFNKISASSLYRIDGQEINLIQEVQDLCDAINTEKETNWCLGECGEFTLDSFIVGAYWAFNEWHGGQASKTYKTLCMLGSIFSPNMSTLEDNTNEKDVYDSINEYFKNQ